MLGPDEAEGCKMTELGVLRGTVVLEPGLPGGPEGLARYQGVQVNWGDQTN